MFMHDGWGKLLQSQKKGLIMTIVKPLAVDERRSNGASG